MKINISVPLLHCVEEWTMFWDTLFRSIIAERIPAEKHAGMTASKVKCFQAIVGEAEEIIRKLNPLLLLCFTALKKYKNGVEIIILWKIPGFIIFVLWK